MRVTADVKQATEKAIRAAARKLFTRKGFEGTSTRQIADAAGIATGTLFNYFPSKEALAIALAADCFADGRGAAKERLASRSRATLDEDLFTLVAADIRALEPIRPFIADVLEAGLSPFAASTPTGDTIRTARLEDAATLLASHAGDTATPALMHLYWSLYVGVLSFWARDGSPKQEDTWALLDQGMRMFAASAQGGRPDLSAGGASAEPPHVRESTRGDRPPRPSRTSMTAETQP